MQQKISLKLLAAEAADEYYDKYLQDRKGIWGYRPIENLENVSYPTTSPTKLTTSSKTAEISYDLCLIQSLGDVRVQIRLSSLLGWRKLKFDSR